MESFNAIFKLESKRLINRKTIGLFFFVSLLALYYVQTGINNYKSIIENRDSFQAFEKMRVNQYQNYNQYGTYGFRLLFIPSPLSIFFVNSSVISELTSNVDSGVRLNIYNSFKGKSLFAEKSGGFKDFSGIMLLLGSLLVLYFGYEAMIYKDYSRFMTGFSDHRLLFAAAILARLTLIFLFLLITSWLALILLKLNGIQFSAGHYIYFGYYMGGLFLIQVFFFSLGTIAGSFKSPYLGFVLIIASWFALVFMLPGVVSGITSARADNISSNYHLEMEKLKRLMGFEKKALETVGVTSQDNIDSVQELIERYWNNEFKNIQALEIKLEDEMKRNINDFDLLSLFLPSTFYLAASNEISSKGYENFISFFNYIRNLKGEFVRFCLDHRYYSPESLADTSAELKVEPFIKRNENLFYARSRLPAHVLFGTLLTLLYIVGLLVISYARFRKSLQL
jgi:ABC-type transport system involved in multi-copper enzyme maturation permease subunit